MTLEDREKTATEAAEILAAIRAGTHPHGDIRDVGRLLNGKWDQDFPTRLLELAAEALGVQPVIPRRAPIGDRGSSRHHPQGGGL